MEYVVRFGQKLRAYNGIYLQIDNSYKIIYLLYSLFRMFTESFKYFRTLELGLRGN